MKTELEKFHDLVNDIEIGMMPTRRTDGHLRSRAMATQKPAAAADLWFVAADDTERLRDLEHDPHVNLTHDRESSREWVSVSGIATISRDRQKIRES